MTKENVDKKAIQSSYKKCHWVMYFYKRSALYNHNIVISN